MTADTLKVLPIANRNEAGALGAGLSICRETHDERALPDKPTRPSG